MFSSRHKIDKNYIISGVLSSYILLFSSTLQNSFIFFFSQDSAFVSDVDGGDRDSESQLRTPLLRGAQGVEGLGGTAEVREVRHG